MWRHLLQAFSARVHPRRCESQHGVEQSATTSPMSSCGQASLAQLEVTVAEKTACEKRPRDERQAALAEPPMVVQLEKAIEAQCLVDGVAGAMNSSRLACGVVHHEVDRACPLPPREAEAQSQWLLLRHPVRLHLWMGLEGAVASGLWEIAGGEASLCFDKKGFPSWSLRESILAAQAVFAQTLTSADFLQLAKDGPIHQSACSSSARPTSSLPWVIAKTSWLTRGALCCYARALALRSRSA